MLRHETGDMGLAENPWDTKKVRYEPEDMDLLENPFWWMLQNKSDTWILQRILRNENAEKWMRRHGSCRGSSDAKMLRHESGDMDLAEDYEIRRCWDMTSKTWILERIIRCKDAQKWIRRRWSCKGSRDKHGSWYMDRETWILRGILKWNDVEICIQRDMDPAEDPEF